MHYVELVIFTGSHLQVYDDAIPIHSDFRMIVLANRPGFPFLGNDFYAAVGKLTKLI